MKKIISVMISAIMIASMLSVAVFAGDAQSADVFVTIVDGDGKLVVTLEKITVTDIDNDGELTVNDALYCAHEQKFDGGAAAGYASASSDWGLSLTKLWGVENGGSYGYYVNNVAAMGLTDKVKDGDLVNAFVYTDLTTWSDTYCYFDVSFTDVKAGGELTLKLMSAGYDASFNPISVPVAGAVITLDGSATEYKTDDNGNVTVKFDNTGVFTVSATSESARLVSPASVITVTAENVVSPDTGDVNVIFLMTVAVAALVGFGAICATSKKHREN